MSQDFSSLSLYELLQETNKIPLAKAHEEQPSHSGVSRESLANTMPERGVDTSDLPSPKRRKTKSSVDVPAPTTYGPSLNHKASNISRTSSEDSQDVYWDVQEFKISEEHFVEINDEQDEQDVEDMVQTDVEHDSTSHNSSSNDSIFTTRSGNSRTTSASSLWSSGSSASDASNPKRLASDVHTPMAKLQPTTPGKPPTARTSDAKFMASPAATRTVIQTPPSPQSPLRKQRQRNIPSRRDPSPMKDICTGGDTDVEMAQPPIPAPVFSRTGPSPANGSTQQMPSVTRSRAGTRDGGIDMPPPLVPAPSFAGTRTSPAASDIQQTKSTASSIAPRAPAAPTAVPQVPHSGNGIHGHQIKQDPPAATPPQVEEKYDHLLGDGGLSVSIEIIAHSKDVQREMDSRRIAWGVQYELARGVSCGWWKWEDITPEKLEQLRGSNVVAASKVMKLMVPKDKRERPEVLEQAPLGDVMALWKEYDREQEAIVTTPGRGLGLMGDWKDVPGWYGGRIQQVVRLTQDMKTLFLEPPDMTRSNRFARFLGSRRLLELRVGRKAKYADGALKARLAKRFVLCGRVFVPIDSKDGKVYLMETNEDYERYGTPSEGDQHRMSLQDFIQWHNPLSRNYKQPMSKWVTRFDLGLSTSVPVLQFEPENVHFMGDIYAPHKESGKVPAEKTMTDGCGWINTAALIRIAQQLGCAVRPTAVQGRIAGAKGVWLLHPDDRDPTDPPRIWIRDSQKKIQLPDLTTLGRAHLIFDLVQASALNSPSRLSMQLIINLSHNGVPDGVFKELLRQGLEDEFSQLTKWDGPEAMPLLWDAVNKAGRVTGMRIQRLAGGLSRALGLSRRFDLQDDDEDEEEPPDMETELDHLVSTQTGNGGPPSSVSESVMEMLQAGFKPQTCGYLHEKLKWVVKNALAAYIKKYRIAVPQSAEAFIVPDPFGVLEEGQIHFRASRELKDPVAETDITRITGPVLVSRNPARIASDVQKVTAVVHPALFDYVDVIVFPIKGTRSLASYLGGGDYDGDVAMVTWEPTIVDPFRNHAFVPEPPEIKDSFESDVKQVTEFAGSSPAVAQEQLLKALLAGLGDTKVGKYSKLNDNVVYARGYNDSEAVRLAYMFTTCLDAKKTGLRLKQEVVQADFLKYDVPKPECMQSEDAADNETVDNRIPLRRRKGLPKFVLDSLLATGKELQDMHLETYEHLVTQHSRPDQDLLLPIEKAFTISQALIREELQRIQRHVEESQQNYRQYWSILGKPVSKKGKSSPKAAQFHERVRKPYAEGPNVPLIAALSNLDELRASCAYKQAKGEKFAFEVAFKALCSIKARAINYTPISQQFASLMQMQSAAVRILRNAQNEDTV